MLAPYIGKPIVAPDGSTSILDGSVQTYFSATPEQRADQYGNYVLGLAPLSPIFQGVQQRDADRLANLAALNGAATPDYSIDGALIFGSLAGKLSGTIARIFGSSALSGAGTVTASEGGNISASQISAEGISVSLNSAERGILSQISSLANTKLQGDAREYVANNYFVRNGFTSLDGKCGVNCFDGVYLKGNTVYINEVKPLNVDGSIKLNGPTANLATQMTDSWITSAVGRLNSGSAEQRAVAAQIESAISNNSLVKVVTGVDSNGMIVVKLNKEAL
jgi:filamentous hemagglutinin